MKSLKLKVLGKNGVFTGDVAGCIISLCCSCGHKEISFTYTEVGGGYTKVATGTSGAFVAVEMWDEEQHNLYLIDTTAAEIDDTCADVAGKFEPAVSGATFLPLSTTALPYCITRTKADFDYKDAYAMQLDYMQYGQGVVFQETATEIVLGFTTTNAPVEIGTDVVVQAACS